MGAEMPNARVVLVTCGSPEEGQRIAQTVVSEKLAACVNIVPGLTSVYFWQGAVQTDREVLLIIKTRPEALERLEARIKALHSYTVCEFLVLPVVGGSQAYLDWLAAEVTACSQGAIQE